MGRRKAGFRGGAALNHGIRITWRQGTYIS